MNLGLPELMFIFVIALLIFGPRKLPEISRQIGHAFAEYKRATSSLKWKLEDEVRNLEATSNTHPAVQARISEAGAPQPATGVLEETETVTSGAGAEVVDNVGEASIVPDCDLLQATLQNLPELRALNAAETPNQSKEVAAAPVGDLTGGAKSSPREG